MMRVLLVAWVVIAVGCDAANKWEYYNNKGASPHLRYIAKGRNGNPKKDTLLALLRRDMDDIGGGGFVGRRDMDDLGGGGFVGRRDMDDLGGGGFVGKRDMDDLGGGGFVGKRDMDDLGGGGFVGKRDMDDLGGGGFVGKRDMDDIGGGGFIGRRDMDDLGGGGFVGRRDMDDLGGGGFVGRRDMDDLGGGGFVGRSVDDYILVKLGSRSKNKTPYGNADFNLLDEDDYKAAKSLLPLPLMQTMSLKERRNSVNGMELLVPGGSFGRVARRESDQSEGPRPRRIPKMGILTPGGGFGRLARNFGNALPDKTFGESLDSEQSKALTDKSSDEEKSMWNMLPEMYGPLSNQ